MSDTCRAVIDGKMDIGDYVKKIKLRDPRSMANPRSVPQGDLYLRLVERRDAGKLPPDFKFPEIGEQLPMVTVIDPETKKPVVEHPRWAKEHGMKPDKVYYVEAVLKKMEYLGLDDLIILQETAKRYLLLAKRLAKAASSGGIVFGSSTTPTEAEYRIATMKQRRQAVARNVKGRTKTLQDGVSATVQRRAEKVKMMKRNRKSEKGAKSRALGW